MDFFQSIFKVLNENIVLMIVVIIVTALSLFSILFVIIDKIRSRYRSDGDQTKNDIWNRNFETEYIAEKQERKFSAVSSAGKEVKEVKEVKDEKEVRKSGEKRISVILPRENRTEEKKAAPDLTSVPEATMEVRKNALLKKEEPAIIVKEFIIEDNMQDFTTSQVAAQTIQPITQKRILKRAMLNNQYVSFVYDDKPVLLQPESITDTTIAGFCFIQNEKREFQLSEISDPTLKISPFQVQATGPAVGIGRIREIIHTAIQQNKHLRLKYANMDDSELIVLPSRRIAFNAKNEYITATMDNPLDQRTFQFDRISEIAILNL